MWSKDIVMFENKNVSDRSYRCVKLTYRILQPELDWDMRKFDNHKQELDRMMVQNKMVQSTMARYMMVMSTMEQCKMVQSKRRCKPILLVVLVLCPFSFRFLCTS